MDRKINGHNAAYLKRKAKNLSKAQGITHTQALNLVAKEHGYENWDNFMNKRKPEPRPEATPRRPKVPEPAVLNYHDVRTGAVIGQHPNKKMSVRRHTRVGTLLQELIGETEYHKRAKSALQDIRSLMDTWLGCEYNEAELPNAEFNPVYYGRSANLEWGVPTPKRQAELKRLLRAARSVIDRSYHDCKPLDKLHERFDLALKALEKWPKHIKVPGHNPFRGRVPAGTFVRVDHNKQIGVVFHHDTGHQVIEGYTDGGHFLAGRDEVSVLRKQLLIADFKPMRLCLPYGKWTCANGREVLFNRDYCPIWQRSPDGTVTAIQPDVYVRYETTEHYYNDRSAPYYIHNEATFETCTGILKDWGVAEKRNLVLDLLPAALAAGDVGLLSPKGIS
ncbi:DUF5623 domain-containing protein [Mucilaginibacter sp. BJC16-A38]|uniref:DUF5623 domain-containing protein n=1 Tax=Mucilaginibacter phenanthrenivorans TaxID=1234842 RepID=UPI0021581959|nr:DUF5623 domain-containing protein [Mucilaginibacter phenanthrenivorans]MCR8556976.1 DUF5623 domain-containing protein [Mucilaginibacter phenanthrenivorans]